MRTPTAILAALTLTSAATAVPLTFTIDPAQSSIDAELTVQGSSDSDSSGMSGTLLIDIDTPVEPMNAALLDANFAVDETLDFAISFGFLGGITAQAEMLALAYATPGTPIGPVPIVDGELTLPKAPFDLAGNVSYNASGLICSVIQGQGFLCTDSIDLAAQPAFFADSVAFTITVIEGQLRLDASISGSAPVNSDAPELGSLAIDADIVAFADLPMMTACPTDFDGSGATDLADLNTILAAFGSSAAGDTDNDGDTDLQDLNAVLAAFGSACP